MRLKAIRSGIDRRSMLAPAIFVGGFFLWLGYFHGFAPLPFYSYFFDPELAYYLNSIQLANWGHVQLYEHPGTVLQFAGAGLATVLQIDPESVFADQSIERFRNAWKVIAIVAALLMLVQCYRISSRTGIWATFVVAVFLLLADYNTWAFWGTFTPEGAFFVLYLPLALFFVNRMLTVEKIHTPEWFAWGLVLALITTLKITLWPVTLFLWVIALTRKDALCFRRYVVFGLGFAGIFLVSTGIATLFAEDRMDQLTWYVNLVSESGRYGRPGASEAQAFLPIGEILGLLRNGLSLQNYTTLIPVLFLGALASYDLLSRKSSRSRRILAAGFLLALCLTWVAFAKHPYQIKYLLVQTPLFLLYWIARETRGTESLPPRISFIMICLLAGVVFSAFANYKVLHAYTLAHTVPIKEEIDRVMRILEPEQTGFTLWTSHPLAAKAFALRECLIFEDIHRSTVQKSFSFAERTANHRHPAGAPLPLETIAPGTLVTATQFFADERAPLLHLNRELGLFFYWRPKSDPDQ